MAAETLSISLFVMAPTQKGSSSMSVYESLPDKKIIKAVNKLFYEKVYKHPWLSLYFEAVTEEHITQQQTDFITAAIGGPKKYSGRLASNAHPHMYIDDELFELRSSLLQKALIETKAPEELVSAWTRIDKSFRSTIVKKSLSDCKGRYGLDKILYFKNPSRGKKTA